MLRPRSTVYFLCLFLDSQSNLFFLGVRPAIPTVTPTKKTRPSTRRSSAVPDLSPKHPPKRKQQRLITYRNPQKQPREIKDCNTNSSSDFISNSSIQQFSHGSPSIPPVYPPVNSYDKFSSPSLPKLSHSASPKFTDTTTETTTEEESVFFPSLIRASLGQLFFDSSAWSSDNPAIRQESLHSSTSETSSSHDDDATGDVATKGDGHKIGEESTGLGDLISFFGMGKGPSSFDQVSKTITDTFQTVKDQLLPDSSAISDESDPQ